MTAAENALRYISQLRPMALGLAAAAIFSFAAVAVVFLLCRKSWIPDKGFRLLGLFFGLRLRETLRLSCCWLKLVLVLVFVAIFQPLDALHYFMVLFVGLCSVLLDYGLLHRLEDAFWLSLELIGLTAANLLCRFVKEMSGSREYVWIYYGMGLLMVLFSLYLFLNELSDLSQYRDIDAHEVWGAEE